MYNITLKNPSTEVDVKEKSVAVDVIERDTKLTIKPQAQMTIKIAESSNTIVLKNITEQINIYEASVAGGSTRKVYQSPIESPNGVRVIFTTTEPYRAESLTVFLNGLQESNITELSTTQFEFSDAPFTTDTIKLEYNI